MHLIKCCTAKPDKSTKESNPKTTQNYELQTRKSRNTRAEYIKIYQLQKKNYVHFFVHFTKKNFLVILVSFLIIAILSLRQIQVCLIVSICYSRRQMCQICFKQIQIDTLFQQGNYIIEHTFFQLFTSAYYTASSVFFLVLCIYHRAFSAYDNSRMISAWNRSYQYLFRLPAYKPLGTQ